MDHKKLGSTSPTIFYFHFSMTYGPIFQDFILFNLLGDILTCAYTFGSPTLNTLSFMTNTIVGYESSFLPKDYDLINICYLS